MSYDVKFYQGFKHLLGLQKTCRECRAVRNNSARIAIAVAQISPTKNIPHRNHRLFCL